MQYIGYLMFVIGAAGVDGDDMIKSALICFAGLVVLAVSAWKERRELWQEQHTTQKNLQRFSDVQKVRHTHLSA